MSSWRESANQRSQHQLDALLDVGMTQATHVVGERGELYPFGVVWRTGQPEPEAVSITRDDAPEFPDPNVLIADLVEHFREERDRFDATALVLDTYANGIPAITIELEHRDGISLAVLLPYQAQQAAGTATFGELMGAPREPQIWV